MSKPWSRPRTECTASLLRFDMDQARVHGVGDKVSGAVPLATVNADRGSWSDPHQHSCHEDNDGGGKRHPLRKHHFLPSQRLHESIFLYRCCGLNKDDYPPLMAARRPSGFIEPCLPSKVVRPSGSGWLHEIKFDGYRLMVRRDGPRVRCFTRNGYDWAKRFPTIVAAAHRIKASRFLIDGEVVILRNDGTSDFRALRSRRRGHEAVLYDFDLIEQDDDDLRDLPLIERKQRLKKLIGKARHAILFTEHLIGDGAAMFRHVSSMGLEGIVSKRTDAPYRRGSIPKTRRAMRCAGRVRKNGARANQQATVWGPIWGLTCPLRGII